MVGGSVDRQLVVGGSVSLKLVFSYRVGKSINLKILEKKKFQRCIYSLIVGLNTFTRNIKFPECISVTPLKQCNIILSLNPHRTKTILNIREKVIKELKLTQSSRGASHTLNHTIPPPPSPKQVQEEHQPGLSQSGYSQSNHHKPDFYISKSKISYTFIDPQLLHCTPACNYKFHTLAIYQNPKLTVPSIGAFCRNSQRVKALGYFHRRTPSWMFDSVPNATLPNKSLQLQDDLSRTFPPVTQVKLPTVSQFF